MRNDYTLSATAVMLMMAMSLLVATASDKGPVVPFEMNLQAVDCSGAGESTNSDFRLVSNVGQPLTQLSIPSSGDGFTLRSGFLGLENTPPPVTANTWTIR